MRSQGWESNPLFLICKRYQPLHRDAGVNSVLKVIVGKDVAKSENLNGRDQDVGGSAVLKWVLEK
jgi:hypothetical protein